MATYNYMMCKEAVAIPLVAPILTAGARALPWVTRIGAKAKALPGAQAIGQMTNYMVPILGFDAFNKWTESKAEAEARKNAEAAYAKFLPINREKLRRENIKNILMYTGASAAGASAGYYLSEKNKRRNALLGAVIAPTALHVARSAYNSMNISPEAYTRQQVGLS